MKYLLLITSVLISTLCAGQKYKGDSWAKVKENGGTLSIIFYQQAGLITKDPATGKMKGVCVDILSDFAQFVQDKYGKKLTIDYVGEESIFPTFMSITQNTPNIMGVTNVIITEERKTILKFTPSFLLNPLVMMTHKDAPTLTNLAEIGTVLKDYSAKVIKGSVHVKVVEKIKNESMPGLKILYADSGTEILKELSAGTNKTFTVLDFMEYIDANRRQLPVKRQNVDLGKAQELGFIMAKQTDWDKPWNEFMTLDYKKGVRYRRIIVDNLGANFLQMLK